jgi:tRNA G26 N,N-dimethylase Trm1
MNGYQTTLTHQHPHGIKTLLAPIHEQYKALNRCLQT